MLYLLEALFALAPLYVWRFPLGRHGSINFLEIAIPLFWIVCIVYFAHKRQLREFAASIKNQPKFFLLSIALFLVAAAISVDVSPDRSRAVGIFIAFFLEPTLTYFFAAYILKEERAKIHFIKFVLLVAALFSAYGILQYFSRIGLPQEWWGNANEPKRIISVFEYPNAFALWLTPILVFCLPLLLGKAHAINRNYLWAYLVSLVGLLLSLSRGGWYGFAAAAIIFVALYADAKTRKILGGAAIVAVLIVAAVPNLRYRVILPFEGEKSTVSRFSLWHTADKMIASAPVLGKGLYGFKTDFDAYNTDPNLVSLDYPHNIFLNFWVETGLLGLLSFLMICGYKIFEAIKNPRDVFKIGIVLFLAALFVHGLVDAPYLKNDLALVFWTFLAIA